MRFYETDLIQLSEDTLQVPKKMRFSEATEDTDTTLLKECLVRQETFPVGTHSISLGNIAQGKWLFVKPTNDLQVKLDAGSNMTFRAGKVTKMWVNFTALEITVSTADQVVVLVVAGE